MKKIDTFFAFDLDGTVTKEEILPVIARELKLEEEMSLLTELTLNGTIEFQKSFKLRVEILRNIPISKVQEIISDIKIDKNIQRFIQNNKERCAIVTGNLDIWIEPIAQSLGCKVYSSKARMEGDKLLGIDNILVKSEAIFDIRKYANKVVTIGESINDIPMFTEGDIGIAYGGVHQPVEKIISVSDYVVFEGRTLCNLLNTL